jgi:UDP-glucose 4-epimerase
MKVVVTGGAGFIGSNLVRLLVEEGHSVTVLDNFASGYRVNLKDLPIERFIVGDVRDRSMVDAAISRAEIVFHLAASVGNSRSIDHPFVDMEMNCLGTLNVLESARLNGVRKVVFSSSAGIFGELMTLPIAENHPVEPDSPYGASKLYAEKVALAYSKLYKLEVICLRYFNVFGLNQRYDAYGNVIPIFAHKLMVGQPITIFGDGEQTRDFINVRDVVRANYLAGTNNGISDAFNLGSGSAITINKLAELMQSVSGLRGNVVYGPPRKGDVRHSRADISAIGKALGFQPAVEFETGLREYMHWAKSAFNPAGS